MGWGDGKPKMISERYVGTAAEVEALPDAREERMLPKRTRHLNFIDEETGPGPSGLPLSPGTYLALAALNRAMDPCSKRGFADWWRTTKAKQKRSDLRLVGLGLVVTRDGGIPLLSQAYPGSKPCEHVIPNWARRSFNITGPVTVDAREEGLDQRRRVGSMHALNVTLRDAICEDCNSVWLSRLERAVKPVLAPMAVSARPTALSPASQKLMAAWAVKTVLLLELALRQMYPVSRSAEGYQASQPDFAWLRAKSEPPPRFMPDIGVAVGRTFAKRMPARPAWTHPV